MVFHDGYEKVAHLYDIFDVKENVDFFVGYATEAGEILDIGAGTGRIAIPIAEQGARVWCVEPSRAMLSQFREKLAKNPEISDRITLIEKDAVGFRVRQRFPAAVMSGSFDHLLTEEERREALANIGGHLDMKGRLVFDIGLGYMDDSPLKPAGEKIVGATTYRRFVGRKVAPGPKIAYSLVFEIVEGGTVKERIEQTSFAGIVDRPTVHRLLKEAGFRIAREFGGYGSVPYCEGDDILVIEAFRQPSERTFRGSAP
jgi:SAM-dependent methyltransferase